MTTRSQKRKTAAELRSAEHETPITDYIRSENLIAGSSKFPIEILDESKRQLIGR